MDAFKWGEWIEAGTPGYPVQGSRPEWLANYDGELVVRWFDGIETNPQRLVCFPAFKHVAAFRLPADHWAYTPIKAGFTPWAGGDRAPDDWDASAVMLNTGAAAQYDRNSPGWRQSTVPGTGYAIGYKRIARVNTPPSRQPTIIHNTSELTAYLGRSLEWTGDTGEKFDGPAMASLIERAFAPHVPTVKACIAFARNNGFHGAADAMQALLPPDPIETLARELCDAHGLDGPFDDISAAARAAWRLVAQHVQNRERKP